MNQMLENFRKWASPILIPLAVGYLKLSMDNLRLDVSREVSANYVTRSQYAEDRRLVDQTAGKLEAKIDSLNIKLDATLLSQTAMQERLRMMQERIK